MIRIPQQIASLPYRIYTKYVSDLWDTWKSPFKTLGKLGFIMNQYTLILE
jgi:hypothetical protein